MCAPSIPSREPNNTHTPPSVGTVIFWRITLHSCHFPTHYLVGFVEYIYTLETLGKSGEVPITLGTLDINSTNGLGLAMMDHPILDEHSPGSFNSSTNNATTTMTTTVAETADATITMAETEQVVQEDDDQMAFAALSAAQALSENDDIITDESAVVGTTTDLPRGSEAQLHTSDDDHHNGNTMIHEATGVTDDSINAAAAAVVLTADVDVEALEEVVGGGETDDVDDVVARSLVAADGCTPAQEEEDHIHNQRQEQQQEVELTFHPHICVEDDPHHPDLHQQPKSSDEQHHLVESDVTSPLNVDDDDHHHMNSLHDDNHNNLDTFNPSYIQDVGINPTTPDDETSIHTGAMCDSELMPQHLIQPHPGDPRHQNALLGNNHPDHQHHTVGDEETHLVTVTASTTTTQTQLPLTTPQLSAIPTQPRPPPTQQPQQQRLLLLQTPQPPVPELTNPICRICGQGNEEGRPVLRFLPVTHDAGAARAAPCVVTFTDDICLHIFCGKTASILPTVNRPDLEILTKAGLKNKHGIGPEVNAALARTRAAIPWNDNKNGSATTTATTTTTNGVSSTSITASKEKQYYLVREFEAHLASIRHTKIRFSSNDAATTTTTNNTNTDAVTAAATTMTAATTITTAEQSSSSSSSSPPLLPTDPFVPQDLAALGDAYNVDVAMDYAALTADVPPPPPLIPPPPVAPSVCKTIPTKANVGQIHKPFRRKSQQQISNHQLQQQQQQIDALISYGAEIQPDGKIKCPCGGTHLPPNKQRGTQSWRNHIMTKRHQKWMEEHGLLGIV